MWAYVCLRASACICVCVVVVVLALRPLSCAAPLAVSQSGRQGDNSSALLGRFKIEKGQLEFSYAYTRRRRHHRAIQKCYINMYNRFVGKIIKDSVGLLIRDSS